MGMDLGYQWRRRITIRGRDALGCVDDLGVPGEGVGIPYVGRDRTVLYFTSYNLYSSHFMQVWLPWTHLRK